MVTVFQAIVTLGIGLSAYVVFGITRGYMYNCIENFVFSPVIFALRTKKVTPPYAKEFLDHFWADVSELLLSVAASLFFFTVYVVCVIDIVVRVWSI